MSISLHLRCRKAFTIFFTTAFALPPVLRIKNSPLFLASVKNKGETTPGIYQSVVLLSWKIKILILNKILVAL